jgi:GAF domain-containing protein
MTHSLGDVASPQMLACCQTEVEKLLASTGASRTPLRLENDEGGFPVVAEACAGGERSLRGEERIVDLRAAPTFIALDRDRKILLQEDLEHADPAPPPMLIARYGARAQMLAPLVHRDRPVGIVSVHETSGPRHWREQDVRALTAAAIAMARALGADAGPSA